MHIWAVANQKGGVGKTTTTVSLGGLLADQGKRVLMVDLDAQGSLSSYFRMNPEDTSPSSLDLFVPPGQLDSETVTGMTRAIGPGHLHLLPASTALATLERKAVTQEGMGLALSRGLVLLWDDYDYVLIDSPPTLGVLLVNTLAACSRLLIPVQTEYLALKGLERMMRTLEMVTRSRPHPLPTLLVPTLFDRHTRIGMRALMELRNRYPDQVWSSVIPVDTRLRDASARGITPVAFDRECRGVKAYAFLLKHLLETERRPAEAEPLHG